MNEKRELESREDQPAHSKRVKLDELSEEGPLTQEDVVYFQKEAIFRKLSEYKQQIKVVNKSYKIVEDEFQANSEKLSLLKTWIEQLVQAVGVAGTGNSDAPSYFIDISLNDQEFSSFLDKLKQSLSEIISKENLKISDKDLNSKFAELSRKFSEISNEKTKIELEYKKLNKQYEMLEKEHTETFHKLQRCQSKTLERVKPKSEDDDVEVKPEDKVKPEVKEETPVVAETNGSANNNSSSNTTETIDPEQYEKLNTEIEEFKAIITTQKQEIEDLLSLNGKLQTEVDQIKIDNVSSVEKQQEHKEQQKSETSELEELKIKYQENLQKYDLLFEKYNNIENEKKSIATLLESKIAEESNKVIANFEKLESDLVRIRTNRDDLLSKINILENEKNGLKSFEELLKLTNLQKSTIENLNFEKQLAEVARAQEGEGEGEGEIDHQMLKKHNLVLINELKELEKAFKQVEEISIKKIESQLNHESIINKLSIEKSKADQKYFSAMRSKDAITQENKTLKLQIEKLNEVISNLKSNQELMKEKFKLLEEENKLFKKTDFFKRQENEVFLKKIDNLTMIKNSLSENFESLKSTIKALEVEKSELLKTKTDQNIKISKLESNLKSKEKILSKIKGNHSNGGSLADINDDVNDSFRSLVYCSLCSKNWKNTALKVCGHVFCNECTQERLAARMRKCPICNKQFGSNDVMPIHL